MTDPTNPQNQPVEIDPNAEDLRHEEEGTSEEVWESALQANLTKLWVRHTYRIKNPPAMTPHGMLEESQEYEHEEDMDLGVDAGDVPPADINMTLSKTTNLGNYNSMRIAIGIRVPVPVTEIDSSVPMIHQFLAVNLQSAHKEGLGNG